MNKTITTIAILALAFTWANCGGGGEEEEAPTTTITLSGQVAVSSSDLNLAAIPKEQIELAKATPIKFLTKANSALPSATVNLYKINADGTEEAVSGITTTTDSSGNYTLENVPVAQTGTGAATDFYYEVRATSGLLDVRAPTAPTADTTVNLSPETKVAARIISDVAEISETETPNVLPTESKIEHLREIVADNIADMTNFTPPSTAPADANDSHMVIAATAVASNNGNSEKLTRAYEAQLEEAYLEQNKTIVSDDNVAGYLDRITKAACNFNTNMKLPQTASAALSDAFKAGTTFGVDDIVDAFNDNSPNDTNTSTTVSAFTSMLDDLENELTDKSDISSANLFGLYADRGDLSNLSSTTELEADQALALVQTMLPSNNQCQIGPGGLDYIGFVSDLTGDTTIKSASFADTEVYHTRSGNCPEGQLNVRVQLYLPNGVTANGVTLSASGMTNTSGQTVASTNLTENPQGSKIYTHGNNVVCLTFNQEYTYIIAADLEGTADISEQITRTVYDLPEARITLIDDYTEHTLASTGSADDPIQVTNPRPMFKWTTSQPFDAPTGTKVKYIYDLAHFQTTNCSGDCGPQITTDCPGEGTNTGRFYDKDYVLSSIDCYVDICNAATGNEHTCRLHVQSVLVDEYDRTLAWSPGSDIYYCIPGQTNCQ